MNYEAYDRTKHFLGRRTYLFKVPLQAFADLDQEVLRYLYLVHPQYGVHESWPFTCGEFVRVHSDLGQRYFVITSTHYMKMTGKWVISLAPFGKFMQGVVSTHCRQLMISEMERYFAATPEEVVTLTFDGVA